MKEQILLALLATTALIAHTDDPLERPENAIALIKDKVHFYGDYRIRDQEVHRDDGDNSYDMRYRIRLGLSYDVSENIIIEAQTSSGVDNPTSGNVDFADGLDFDSFKLDVLDVQYKLDNAWVRAGKSKHYFYRPMKTQLIWDNDLRPEGLSYGYDNGDKFTAGIWKVHRIVGAEDIHADDIFMFVGQYAHQMQYTEQAMLNFTAGFYHYDGVKGNVATYPKGPLGNSYVGGIYVNNYSIAELSAEAQLKSLWGKPLYLASTLAYNAAASDYNFGYDLSIQWGLAKKNNLDWQVGYTYRDIQKDAVYGAHNDSDFINGGTDGRGHILTGKIKLNSNLDAAYHYQWTDKDISTTATHYDRLMADLILKF